ncbi:MAG TPA: hypothetical protein VFY43_07420 [Candidatus Limnocylindria bacterium]|nr:hypothetical protein [Candidatus Limnocylindria bacterium]
MTTARPIPSARRRGHALAGMAFACALILLAACGGGGGGGGDATYKLRLATTNETPAAATVTLDVDGEPGEPQTLDSCTGTVYTFDLPADPATWAVTINDEIAIDSTQLDPNLIDKNLIAAVVINEDGTIEFPTEVVAGALISGPAATGICL